MLGNKRNAGDLLEPAAKQPRAGSSGDGGSGSGSGGAGTSAGGAVTLEDLQTLLLAQSQQLAAQSQQLVAQSQQLVQLKAQVQAIQAAQVQQQQVLPPAATRQAPVTHTLSPRAAGAGAGNLQPATPGAAPGPVAPADSPEGLAAAVNRSTGTAQPVRPRARRAPTGTTVGGAHVAPADAAAATAQRGTSRPRRVRSAAPAAPTVAAHQAGRRVRVRRGTAAAGAPAAGASGSNAAAPAGGAAAPPGCAAPAGANPFRELAVAWENDLTWEIKIHPLDEAKVALLTRMGAGVRAAVPPLLAMGDLCSAPVVVCYGAATKRGGEEEHKKWLQVAKDPVAADYSFLDCMDEGSVAVHCNRWYKKHLGALGAPRDSHPNEPRLSVGDMLNARALAVMHFCPYDLDPTKKRILNDTAFKDGFPSMTGALNILRQRITARSGGGAAAADSSMPRGSGSTAAGAAGGGVAPIESCIFLAMTPAWRNIGIVQLAKDHGCAACKPENQGGGQSLFVGAVGGEALRRAQDGMRAAWAAHQQAAGAVQQGEAPVLAAGGAAAGGV